MGYDGTLKFDTSIDSSGFQSGLSKLSGMASGAIKATTTILAGAATAVAGIGTAAIKVGSDFEAGMSKVQSISGASATEIQQLADKAKEMGAKTKFSATESAEAFQYMAMAGWKTGDMLNSIEGIMNLAAASGEDLASTSDIVTDAMTAFGLAADGTTTIIKNGYSKEVSNATHFADVLAAASSNAERLPHRMGQLPHILDDKVVLGNGHGDTGNIHLLEGIPAQQGDRHVASNRHHRDGIHVGRGQTRHQVCGAGAGGGDAHSHLARGSGVAVRGMGGTLLMGGQHMGDAVLVFVKGVVKIEHRAAGIAENRIHPLFQQALHQNIRSVFDHRSHPLLSDSAAPGQVRRIKKLRLRLSQRRRISSAVPLRLPGCIPGRSLTSGAAFSAPPAECVPR